MTKEHKKGVLHMMHSEGHTPVILYIFLEFH